MNVLSLCDGMSCGHIALELAGFEVDKYFASEIKKHAIRVTKTNFPDTIHIGNVLNVSYKDGVLHTENGDFETQIDLVCFGSPCQSFSRAMKDEMRIGLDDPVRSGLFYTRKRVLDEVKPKYFLLENVVMKEEDENFLTQQMGVEPIRINSAIVTGQIRERLYWTNIPYTPIQKRHITQEDILDKELGGYMSSFPTRCLVANDSHGYYNDKNENRNFYHTVRRQATTGFVNYVVKSKQQFQEFQNNLSLGRKDQEFYSDLRFFTKYERARLQGCPEHFADCMTEKEAADLFGDGWTCSVIAHIFKGMHSGEVCTLKQLTFDDLFN